MKTCPSVRVLAKELDVERRLLYRWKEELDPQPQEPALEVSSTAQIGHLKQQVARLETVLGRKALEVEFFKAALQKVEARRRSKPLRGSVESMTRSEK